MLVLFFTGQVFSPKFSPCLTQQEKDSGRTFALKRCFDAFQNSTDAQRTFREIIFLQELNGHENIVRLMNVMKADSSQDLYVIFDYMESDLQKAIVGNLLQPIHVEYITYQVLKALKYIHSAGVLHRDLKPANVLLNSNCHARICDFGLARTALPQLLPTRRDSRSSEGEAPPLLTDSWFCRSGDIVYLTYGFSSPSGSLRKARFLVLFLL